MSRDTWRQYFILIGILAVLTALAIVGMLQIFNAADEARHNIKVTQCQNIILGEAVHQFHVSLGQLEADEKSNEKIKLKLLQQIQNEPDIALAMKACNHS